MSDKSLRFLWQDGSGREKFDTSLPEMEKSQRHLTVNNFFLQMVTAAMKSKDTYSLEGKL